MRSFAQRLTLRFAALVTATTATVLAVGGWLLNRQIIASAEFLHDVEFRELRGIIGNDPAITSAEIARRIAHDADSDAALYFIQIHSERGIVVFRSPNLGENFLPDLSGRELHWTFDLAGVGPVRISEFHDGPWHFQIASALAPLHRVLRDYVEVAAILVAGVGFLSVALGWAFARVTLRPIRAIEATANRIRSDNLSERIPVPSGRDELSALSQLLNQMFDRIEAAFSQVRRFTADASHEFKTPLALIRLNAEKLRASLAADPEGLSTLEDLLEEISRLHRMIDSLLFLSRAESGVLELRIKPMDVPAFLRDVAEDASALAQDQDVRFIMDDVQPGELTGEPTLLRQLLLNLVTNALNVSPPGATVTLSARHLSGGWHLEISDEGPGLKPEQLERIFERFVRFEAMPGKTSSGHGLGLAICRSIAALHGGTLRAENRQDRSGLRIVLKLPDRLPGQS